MPRENKWGVPGLSARKGRGGVLYFRYRAANGEYVPLGTDEAVAKDLAMHFNLALQPENKKKALIEGSQAAVSRLLSSDKATVQEAIEIYKPIKLSTINGGPDTPYGVEVARRLKNLGEWFSGMPIRQVSLLVANEVFDVRCDSGETYKQYRIVAKELWGWMVGKALAESNPFETMVHHKLARVNKKKIRKRWELSQVNEVYRLCPEWLQVAMDLIMLTGLRESDISNLEFSHAVDGYLLAVPEKGKTETGVTYGLKMKMGVSLEAVIDRARKLSPDSPYIVHKHNDMHRNAKPAKGRKHWAQVLPQQMSRKLGKIRDLSGLFEGYGEGEEPTLHELRSLASDLYLDNNAGNLERVQKILAHKTKRQTEEYVEGYDVVWHDVDLDLDLVSALGR